MTLAKYMKKRNFAKTPEPRGKKVHLKKSSLLYIIQKHAASHLHYDFRLELQGVLISWAVPKGPCLDPDVKRLAMHVEDHPLEYGSFEGIIPKGQYGGGTVMLWDRGEWISQDAHPIEAYKKGSMKFILKGEKLKGLWKLFRINNDDKTWLLVKAKDEFSKKLNKYDVTLELGTSVLTNQSIDEIAENYEKIWGKGGAKKSQVKKTKPAKNVAAKASTKIKINLKPSALPKVFSPQLATLVDEPPLGSNWLHEIKFDGYRLIAIKKNNKTKLMTRNGNDWTSKFKSIEKSINNLPVENAILDGEVVVLNEHKKSDFQALQNSIKDNAEANFIYYIFDLTYYEKYNLSQLPLLERKNILQILLKKCDDNIYYSDHVVGSGEEILKKSCELSLEGIVSKDGNSEYKQARSTTWLKSKCIKCQEFVIGGYTKPKGKRGNFGALLLGTYNKRSELIYNGNVGTGFTVSSLQSLHQLLKKNETTTSPFATVTTTMKNAVWVKPNLVAEIEFTEWTNDGHLRHPSFKGLRQDKKAKNVVKESAEPIENIKEKPVTKKAKVNKAVTLPLNLSHPNKILYPEDKYTKQFIAEYYDQIQQWILPYIANRPLTLLRCPEGYNQCFYQKHITSSSPKSLHAVTIKEKDGKSECIYIQDREGLMALPQLGVLEIHPWGSRVEDIEYPDVLVFDLDPAPDVPWKKVVEAAFKIKQHLKEFKLTSFIKTTGGKGLHIVIPIQPEFNWDEIKVFTRTFVDYLVLNNPKDYVGNMAKSKRVGKIFIDYLRNQRGATAVSAYSTRARVHAPVSTPLSWDELTSQFADTFYTVKDIPKRLDSLKKDPWKEFFKVKQSLNLDKFK